MRMSRSSRALPRSEGGQAIAEGAAGISLVILFSLLALVFLLDAAASAYYQLKLQAVTLNAAQFAANTAVGDPQAEQKTREFADAQLMKLGLPPSSEFSLVQDKTASFVTVGLSGLRLFGSVGSLPAMISLRDTEMGTSSEAVVGYLRLETEPPYQYKQAWNPAYPDPFAPAFAPIVACGQVDQKVRYMLDSANWPGTHMTYHGAFPNFPNYRGKRAFEDLGSQSLPNMQAKYDEIMLSSDPRAVQLRNSINWPYPCSIKSQQVAGTWFTKCSRHGPPCGPWWPPGTSQSPNVKYINP